MKKLFCFMVCMVMCFSGVACTKQTENAVDVDSVSQEEATLATQSGYITTNFKDLSFEYKSEYSIDELSDSSWDITFEKSVAFMRLYASEIGSFSNDMKESAKIIQHKQFIDVYDVRDNVQTATDVIAGYNADVTSFAGTKGNVNSVCFVITFNDENYCYSLFFSTPISSEKMSEYLDDFLKITESMKPIQSE